MGLIQEKFQVTEAVPHDDNGHQWVSDKSVRCAEGGGGFRVDREGQSGGRLNRLPPGTDISNQSLADTRTPVRTMSGETDVTKDWSPAIVRKGFKRFDVKPTDDAYTAEHTDTFYGEAKVDGETGFAERGNLLDRI